MPRSNLGPRRGPRPASRLATLPQHVEPHPSRLSLYTQRVYDAAVIRSVRLSRGAEKDLERVPGRVALKLVAWMEAVEYEGLEEVRRIPGFHDEPLQGTWHGHRSIRLNRAYRAIYRITSDDGLELVYVEKVTKHEY